MILVFVTEVLMALFGDLFGTAVHQRRLRFWIKKDRDNDFWRASALAF